MLNPNSGAIRMHLSRMKSPKFYLPTALILILAVVSTVVFHPAFQKKMLQDHAAPLVDSLDIGYIHLLPWSLEIQDVAVQYRGGHFAVGQGNLRFNPFSLLFKNVNLKTIALKDLSVDLEKFTLPETPATRKAGPFPGVLASLRNGFGYTLQEVAVEAMIRLPEKQSLSAHISGGAIKPESSGIISYEMRFDMGHQEDHVEVSGHLGLDQLKRGRFAAVQTELAVQTMLAALPQPENTKLVLTITPAAPEAGPAQDSLPAAGDQGPHYAPEALRFSLRLPDAEGGDRSALNLEAIYDGNTGSINGRYQVTANERLLGPYLKDTALPPAGEMLTGEFAFDSVGLTGDMTVQSDLAVKDIRELHSHEGLPEMLQLKSNFRLSLLPGRQVRVQTLDSELYERADQKRLESSLAGDLHIALDDPTDFLHQENTLLDFTLPGLPLAWFNVLVPDYRITDGTLTAAFEVATDSNAAIHLKAIKPLQVDGLTVMQQDKTVVQNLNLSVLPGVVYGNDALSVSLQELTVDGGRGTLATADLTADIELSEPGRTGITTQAKARMDLHLLLEMLAIKPIGLASLPRRLDLAYQAALSQGQDELRAEKFDATVSLEKRTELLRLHLLQPLALKTAPAVRLRGDTTGELAALKFSDIDLSWFSGILPEATLQGKLARAEITVAAEGNGVANLTSNRPVDLRHVTLATVQGAQLDDLSIRLMPNIRFAPEGTRVDYRNLEVTGGQAKLVSGAGQFTLPVAQGNPLQGEGHFDADLQGLSKQPFIVRALQASVEAPVRLQAEYRLALGEEAVDIDRLSVSLFYDDPEPRLSLQAESNLRVRTRLGGGQSELGRATGKVTVALSRITPEPFASILKARGLVFTRAEGKTDLVSDGNTLSLNTAEPLVIYGIEVHSGDTAVLQPFTLTSAGDAVLEGDTLQATLRECSIAFAGNSAAPALDTHGTLTLKGVGSEVTLDTLHAELSASLPTLLAQPAALPGHGLTEGILTASLQKDADNSLSASARIADLKADKPLALQTLSLDVDGFLIPDGGFDLSLPLSGQGKSGSSDMRVKARYASVEGSDKIMDIDLDSSVFYLNDILSAVETIGGQKNSPTMEQADRTDQEGPPAAEAGRVAVDSKPDARAFWTTTDFMVRLRFKLARLFYTDYLEFRDIQGHASMLPDRLELGDFSAYFHDSPITIDGRMTFTPGQTPYDLNLEAGVDQFDLARFFLELVPGSTPRAEGLFDISLDAFGASPNPAQYRNNLYFDMQLQSQDGVFRPFDPNSPLLAGSSGVAGLVGESVSNLPTGLFGLGAVARLVNYMKEIHYDRMAIHLVRDQSRDVQIKEYVVQSPEILMTATGGIAYRQGVDILDSPLSMEARIDMRERGAAILYNLGLLQSEKDDYGYWKGPVVKVWGNIAQTESNLDEIIRKAGSGAVFGGITRPVSGLWGNLKFWWFGGGKESPENEEPPDK